jgi:hypothetical protein
LSQHPPGPDRDVLSWLALGAAFAVTAFGEYQLGQACGFGRYIAAGIPAALDIYVLRAQRVRRDVGKAVASMIVVNALSHLVSAHLLPVSIPLVITVSAIAPLVLWRVHALQHPPRMHPDAHPQASPTADAGLPEQLHDLVDPDPPPAPIQPVPWPHLGGALVHPSLHPSALPAAQTTSAVHATWTPDPAASDTTDAHLDLPDAPNPDPLLADAARVDQASQSDAGRPASLRRLQNELGIGQPRAQRIRQQLDALTTPENP